MAIKTKTIPVKTTPKIPDINDFWYDDVLHRKLCAKLLDDIISATGEPVTIFLDGEWGSGKTFFLNRWMCQLESEGRKVVMFNAWQDDDICDPLVSMVGQLHINLHSKPGYKRNVASMLKSAGHLINGIVEEMSYITEHHTGLSPTRLVRASGSRLERMIETYSEKIKNKKLFKERLRGLADSVYDKTGYPLVFIVDELDRSKPTFAIEVLERIKHYFDIPHIVFVVGVDEAQLQKTIESVYGAIDTQAYLRRFIDYNLKLPAPNRSDYANMLWSDYKVDEAFSGYKSKSNLLVSARRAKSICGSLCSLHEMTLREMDEVFRIFALILRSFHEDRVLPCELIAALVVLKVRKPEMCMAWLQGEASAPEVIDALLPMDVISNFEHIEDLIAAIYATQYKEVSIVARNTNVFIRKVEESEIDGSEFRNPIPACLRKMKSKDLKAIVSKVKELRPEHGKNNLYTFKNLVRIGSKFDFLLRALQIRDGMPNDISHISQKAPSHSGGRIVLNVDAFPVSIRHP